MEEVKLTDEDREALIDTLAELSDSERKSLFDILTGSFCMACGKVLSADVPHCHCQNDE